MHADIVLDYLEINAVQGSEFAHLLHRLVEREEVIFGNQKGVDLDLDELIFLVKNIWRVKSARSFSGEKVKGEKGLTRYLGDLQFTRYANSH